VSLHPSPFGLNAPGRTSALESSGTTVSMVILTVPGAALPGYEDAQTVAVKTPSA